MIAKEELNILWSLEQTAEKYEDRVAVSDVNPPTLKIHSRNSC